MPTSSCLLFVVFAGNITLLNLIVDDDSCRISDGQKMTRLFFRFEAAQTFGLSTRRRRAVIIFGRCVSFFSFVKAVSSG